MKSSALVLLPDSLCQYKVGDYLYGFVKRDAPNPAVYVLDAKEQLGSGACGRLVGDEGNAGSIGVDWVLVSMKVQVPVVVKLTLGGSELDCCDFCTLVYDRKTFLRSELLVSSKSESKDCFGTLYLALKAGCPRAIKPLPALDAPLGIFIRLLEVFNFLFSACRPVLRYSSFATHLADSTHSLLWALRTFKIQKTVGLYLGNYMLALLVDLFCGFVVLHFLVGQTSAQEVYGFISATTQQMMVPGLLRPLLEFSYYVFLKLGLLGLSFQIAIVTDVFTVATFHIYCIYIYAARLYELQASGLWSLSRLVLGRNRNPQPGRVDSCPYTKEQLFLGTMSFTVLLFLLPTTLVYYVVFVVIRVGIKTVSEVLARLRYCVQAMPLYTTIVWLFLPSYTTMTMKITPKKLDSSLVLSAQPVCSSWFTTVCHCVPPPLVAPPPIPWVDAIKKVFTGKVIRSL
ncbi:hypothetical protein AAG570_011673 [Ranatra chinensis]|uniref:Phosphatidylinositol N-acetylglucosaminyltransferase subunit Q n=1 Tax=Ranatra chinensis TaxID=642074 RepID=A0ABD0YGK0_9HEMI